MPYLVVKWRGQEVYRAELGGPVVIGREIGADVWINDPALSRRHCQIDTDPAGRWWVNDLHSHNGIFVHGTQIERRVLSDGDCVRLGDAEATFREGPFRSRRAALPEDAIYESHMEPSEKSGSPIVLPARTAKLSRATNRPIRPSEVNLLAAPDEPLVRPYALPFTRPAPKVNFPTPKSTESLADDGALPERSRSNSFQWILRKLRLI